MWTFRNSTITIAALFSLALCGTASAAALHFTAKLDGSGEAPPTQGPGAGEATVTLDVTRKVIDWRLEYSGLSGPITLARFRGPEPRDEKDGDAVTLHIGRSSPAQGSETLTDDQIEDLAAGLWTLNLHTAAHPHGEIRGQVLPTE
jgi:hypothetical protein